jgi:hypothetical protein
MKRKLKFSPQAAAAMSILGSDEVMELSTEPNPALCPICGTIGNWYRDPESRDRILCKNDDTHIMSWLEDEKHPTIENTFRIEFPER